MPPETTAGRGETRPYIKDMRAANCRNLTGGLGEHRPANWLPAF
ncbi:MAG: hypothetical protein RH982_01770 [Parvibaculum sp.]